MIKLVKYTVNQSAVKELLKFDKIKELKLDLFGHMNYIRAFPTSVELESFYLLETDKPNDFPKVQKILNDVIDSLASCKNEAEYSEICRGNGAGKNMENAWSWFKFSKNLAFVSSTGANNDELIDNLLYAYWYSCKVGLCGRINKNLANKKIDGCLEYKTEVKEFDEGDEKSFDSIVEIIKGDCKA